MIQGTVDSDGSIISIDLLHPWEIPQLSDIADGELEISIITYVSQGLKVKGYLVKPLAFKGRELPGLVYGRGGIRRVGMVRLPRMMLLAKRGYAVMAPVYRGNLGGEGQEDFGGDDRYDLIHAVRVLKSLPYVAKKPIPLIGFSRGGIMVLSAALECADVGAVAVWGGVSDLQLTYDERVDLRRMLRRVVGHPRKQLDEYILRSPRYFADRIDKPVLIIHGSDDQQVSVKHAWHLGDALESAGKTYDMRIYDGQGHVFTKEADQDAWETIFTWFNKHEAFATVMEEDR